MHLVSYLYKDYREARSLERKDRKIFCVSFKEHFCHHKHGNGESKFSQQLLDNKHSIRSIEDIMENLQITRNVER
jgi:hypothetical protein